LNQNTANPRPSSRGARAPSRPFRTNAIAFPLQPKSGAWCPRRISSYTTRARALTNGPELPAFDPLGRTMLTLSAQSKPQ